MLTPGDERDLDAQYADQRWSGQLELLKLATDDVKTTKSERRAVNSDVQRPTSILFSKA